MLSRVVPRAFIVSCFFAASLGGAPVITFTATGATAAGLRPGAEAIWFVRSVTELNGWPSLSRALHVTPDTDGDGTVAVEEKVPGASVWVVVDFATGAYAVASPSEEVWVRELRERGNGWRAGGAHVDFRVSDVDVLLVRPGRGAWTMRSGQGGPFDGDGLHDGNLRVRLSDLKKVHGDDPTPPVAIPGDLLIAIEPSELLLYVRSAQEGRP